MSVDVTVAKSQRQQHTGPPVGTSQERDVSPEPSGITGFFHTIFRIDRCLFNPGCFFSSLFLFFTLDCYSVGASRPSMPRRATAR